MHLPFAIPVIEAFGGHGYYPVPLLFGLVWSHMPLPQQLD